MNPPKFNPGDRVRYTQEYLDSWEKTVGFPHPMEDIYTIKRQLTNTAFLADGNKKENKHRIIHPWGMEKLKD